SDQNETFCESSPRSASFHGIAGSLSLRHRNPSPDANATSPAFALPVSDLNRWSAGASGFVSRNGEKSCTNGHSVSTTLLSLVPWTSNSPRLGFVQWTPSSDSA